MNHKDLQLFLAVAHHKSFSMAAETVHLSQPAVSKRIANLEIFLECKLFDRVAKKVHLTQSGELFMQQAQNILKDIEQAKHSLKMTKAMIAGKLDIAISHHLGLHRLPVILQQFNQKHPAVEFIVHFEDSEKAYEKVMQAEVELAVNTLATIDHKYIHQLQLWTDSLKFCCAQEHPLTKLTKPSLHDLAEAPCLIPDKHTFTGRILVDVFASQKLQLQPIMQTNFLQTLGKMTAIGLGWSLLPETLIAEQNLVRLPMEVSLERQLGLIHHNQRTLSTAAIAFIEFCADHSSTRPQQPLQ